MTVLHVWHFLEKKDALRHLVCLFLVTFKRQRQKIQEKVHFR